MQVSGKPLRIVILGVHSIDRHQSSRADQIERCERFVESLNGTSRQKYIDLKVSGSVQDRPALQQLFRHIADEQIDIVVVEALDQLVAGPEDTVRVARKFQFEGVEFWTIFQGEGNDNKLSTGSLVRSRFLN